ncbi:MAG: protein-L-isoaspartate O-methyltransferase [Pseudolabrys sp.]|nr:protein-L-isoaspartate O-methyltransferase [Pseudolabrys sp.]
MIDFATARRHMVDGQIRTANVTDRRILAAMAETARERFLPAAQAQLAYLDLDVPVGAGRRLLKPMVFAKLLQALQITATSRVLDVGCATGYGAAVLARLAGQVVALEEEPSLFRHARESLTGCANVTVVNGPLAEGWPPSAPYDAILLEGAAESIPQRLLQQLADEGRLGCVLGAAAGAKAILFWRSGKDLSRRAVFDAAAPLLPGFAKPAEFVF